MLINRSYFTFYQNPLLLSYHHVCFISYSSLLFFRWILSWCLFARMNLQQFRYTISPISQIFLSLNRFWMKQYGAPQKPTKLYKGVRQHHWGEWVAETVYSENKTRQVHDIFTAPIWIRVLKLKEKKREKKNWRRLSTNFPIVFSIDWEFRCCLSYSNL